MQPSLFPSDSSLHDTDVQWQALVSRDTVYDGVFYVGVKTTGIYCKPSCKSRMPLRKNVDFYATPDAAEAAGLRACKRCQPRTEKLPQDTLIEQIRAYLDAQASDQRVTLDDLAAHFNMSAFHLQRTFKQATGMSPRSYLQNARMNSLKEQLRQNNRVTDAIYAAGYQSSSRAYSDTPTLGMTPRAYQAGGAHQTITWGTMPCVLGVLLVGMTDKGVCSVKLGDSVADVLATLRDEYHAAHLTEDPASVQDALEAINAYIEGSHTRIDLPLDIRATDFQRKVWDSLRHIPYGEQRTYAQIAADIQQPTAARAVGNACGSNPVALVIPCHRAVKNGGGVGNYRWGTERKAVLLANEQKMVNSQ